MAMMGAAAEGERPNASGPTIAQASVTTLGRGKRGLPPNRDTRTPGRTRLLIWAVRLALLALLLGLWQWYGSSSGGVFVPTLTETLSRYPDLVSSGGLLHAFWSSNESLVIGYPISAIVGLAFGAWIGRVRVADRAFAYWLDIAMVVPIVAIVPVVIVALGLNLTARVAVVILFATPVIGVNARAAVRVIDNNLVEMAGAFSASRRQIWMAVIIPDALAQLSAGLRIGLGRAISGMIIVELTLVPAGLGGQILDYKATFSTDDLYAVTLVVIAEGILLTSVGQLLERRIVDRIRGAAR